MTDVSKNGKVALTKDKVKKAFTEQEVPVPSSFQPKPSKVERKLTHIGIEHLFVGVLQHLVSARGELGELIEKENGNQIASGLLSNILALENYVEETIDQLAQNVPSHPNVAELRVIFDKLQAELQAAMELHLKNQKGENDESNSSDVSE